MTEEQFRKRSFRYNMEYDFVDKRNGGTRISCLLVAVNFDKECLCLWPLPENEYVYGDDEREFWVNYELCELPLPKLKVVDKPI